MKPLVIFFSLTGDTRFIAQNIAAETGADALELRPFQPYDPSSPLLRLKSLIQVVTRFTPRLRYFERNPNSYDIIFIGSPVWAGTYAAPLRTLFRKIDLKDKKIALFCCHNGNPGKTLYHMRERLAGNDIVGEKEFYRPLTFEKVRSAVVARSWARDIIERSVAVSPVTGIPLTEDPREMAGRCVHF